MAEAGNQAGGVRTHYIIEHFEEELSDWTLSEYVNMLLILNQIYDQVPRTVPHKEILILTNFPFIAKLRRGELPDDADDLGTKKNTERLLKIISKPCFKDSVLISEKSF